MLRWVLARVFVLDVSAISLFGFVGSGALPQPLVSREIPGRWPVTLSLIVFMDVSTYLIGWRDIHEWNICITPYTCLLILCYQIKTTRTGTNPQAPTRTNKRKSIQQRAIKSCFLTCLFVLRFNIPVNNFSVMSGMEPTLSFHTAAPSHEYYVQLLCQCRIKASRF